MSLLKGLPMSQLPKPILPIVLAVAFISCVAVIVNKEQQRKQLEGQLQRSRQDVRQLEEHNESLMQQVSSLESDRNGLDARVRALRSELSLAATNLDESRASIEQLQASLNTIQAGHATLETQIADVTRERDESQQRAQKFAEEKSELDRSILRLRERLTLLDRDYRELAEQLARAQAAPNTGVSTVSAFGPKNHGALASTNSVAAVLSPGTVELPPIVVRKDQAGMSIPVRGRSVEVNEPHRFIVLDKGSMDGVHAGMTFDILRGASAIGRVTVVRVRPQLSACDILRAKTSGTLQAGDQAVQSGP